MSSTRSTWLHGGAGAFSGRAAGRPNRLTLAASATLATLALTTLAPDASAQGKATTKTDSSKTEHTSTGATTTAGASADGTSNAVVLRPHEDGTSTTDQNASTVEPPKEDWDPTDVQEIPGKTYLFVGLRYRGNVIPKFMLNMFVDEGKTIYSNSIGAEIDIRKDGFSLIPSLVYTEYGTGDILFKEKGTKDIPGNYSLVNSSMKAVYVGADLLWSTKISKTLDFEYGAGFGLGVVFGDLVTNWVQQDPNGELRGSNGNRYSACPSVGAPNTGCNKADHQNASVDKVGGYKEPSWFDGGSRPVVFPWISFPQVGLRFKPVKQFEGRLGLGFALTGFWFGLSGNYGLEQKPKP
ncbi:hypothetical protein AKJ09_00716 [Labilithrix luteola]|uniref:Uncharacterized protein n=1 Tax=Labilithrix luteola TaxID=1391654 RepID=A0A0K1PKK6_9BACT|nr:hypothetical protein [Labilithrix luteola]AKU94052.1 hypothetical protein AKJ09_00716 [Labilithrix luteola]